VTDGHEIRKLRERLDLDREEFGQLLGRALGRSPYTAGTIAQWEQNKADKSPGKAVQVFLDELAVSDSFLAPDGPFGPDGEILADDATPPGLDSVPGPPGGPDAQPPLTSGRGVWTTACTELWELIATGVGMVGAAVGSEPLMMDGQIIDADKAALGAAWGKLAETNETFRKMLVGMTEGGAWLQVAMVTGTTVSKCWQSHGAYAAHLSAQTAAADELNGHHVEPSEPVAA
jgi:transcriptional regulator with XRE-family HTH domain